MRGRRWEKKEDSQLTQGQREENPIALAPTTPLGSSPSCIPDSVLQDHGEGGGATALPKHRGGGGQPEEVLSSESRAEGEGGGWLAVLENFALFGLGSRGFLIPVESLMIHTPPKSSALGQPKLPRIPMVEGGCA